MIIGEIPVVLSERTSLMTTNATDTPFPYGTFPVDPEFSTYYTQDFSDARFHPLPDHLPSHHPLLRSLEETYPFNDALPPWWPTCVSQVEPEWLRPLLASVSIREFRTGCIEQARWKAFRQSLSEEQRHALPSSPKIAAFVERTDWRLFFWDRGPEDTPDQLRLVISTRPLDFLYMSNGREWRSCQHFKNGCENYRLPGNFYDTNVAVAMVLPLNANVRDEASVLVRTTLRVFPWQRQTFVVIGRTYHNNETLALLLLDRLAHLFDARELSWGFIAEVNALSYCQNGFLGPELRCRVDQEIFVESEPCWFPESWDVPYVDGGSKEWIHDWGEERDGYYRMRLGATIKLMRSLTPPPVSAQASQSLAQLASTGMYPCLL